MPELTRDEFEAQLAEHANHLFECIDRARERMNCYKRREADIFSAKAFNMSLQDWIGMFEGDE